MAWGWRKTLVAGTLATSFLGGLLGGESGSFTGFTGVPRVSSGFRVNPEIRDALTTSRFEARHPIAAARWDANHTSPAEARLAERNPGLYERLEHIDRNRTLAGVGPSFLPGTRLAAVSPLVPTFAAVASGLGATIGQGLSAVFSPDQPSSPGQSFAPSGPETVRGPGFGFNNV